MAYPDQNYPPETEFNPYSAPRTESRLLTEPEVRGPVDFSVGGVLSHAWKVYMERMGLSIGVTVFAFVVSIGGQIVGGMLPAIVGALVPEPTVILLVSVILGLALMVFGFWIGLGQSLVYLRITQERPTSIGDLFAGGPYLIRSILACLIVGAAGFGLMVLASIPGGVAGVALGQNSTGANAVMGICLLVAFAVLIVYALKLSQFFSVILDSSRLGAMASLKESLRLTRGHTLGILALIFIAGLVNLAGAILLGIGLIFSVPYSFLILASVYTALAPRSNAGVAKPAVAGAYVDL